MTREQIIEKAKNYQGDRLSFADGAEWMQAILTEKAWKAHCNLCHYKVVGGCEVYASYSHCPDVKLIKKQMNESNDTI